MVKLYKVENFRKVDTTKYIEGSLFINKNNVGILHDGTIKTLSTGTPNLRNYVKKSEVKKMIEDILKEVKENEK